MRAIAFLVSLFVLSSVASAQITQPAKRQLEQEGPGWVQLASPTTNSIPWLVNQPNGTIWIGSFDGMFKSVDTGHSWLKVTERAYPIFFDDLNGLATNGEGLLSATSGGGETWIPAGSTGINGGGLYRAGQDWLFSMNLGKIARSTNRGKSWDKIGLDASSLVAINFSDPLHGFVTGPADVNFTGTCFKTYDRGQSWTRVKCPTHDYWSVACMSENTILLFSISGQVARTTNQGLTWSDTLLTEIDEGFMGSFALNNSEVFAVGARGRICYSDDAGISWSTQTSPVRTTLLNIWFLNDSLGFVVGEQGVILRTTNKGKSWVAQSPASSLEVQWRPEGKDKISFDYTLQRNDLVAFSILTIDGRIITELLQSSLQQPGVQHLLLNTHSLSKGAYMFRLTGDHHSASGVFTITK